MGQIVGLKAKPKRANLNALSLVSTPANGEIILVSSDNSMTADGQGYFDCYIVGDGTTAATALKLKSVDTFIGAFDISAYHATGDVLAKYADLSAALGANGANIPQSLRKGGMSIKFLQSSDNKYVQARCISNEFSSNVEDWAFCSEQVTIFNLDFIYVETTVDNKILWGIKTDGNFYFGAGCPPQVKEYVKKKGEEIKEEILATIELQLENKVDKVEGKGLSTNDFTNSEKEVVDSVSIVPSYDYIQALTDNENKILEGIRSDGTKEVNIDVELKGNRVSTITQPEYIEAKTDHNGKLIEGITYDGKKRISDFDDTTKELIKDFVHEGELNSSLVEIYQLDANFVSPVPVAITGTKGDADAEYDFELPLSENAFNIRFKFRITEDIYNLNETVTIANIGNISIVATPTKLTQRVTDYTLDSETRHSYWPSFVGGISINNSYIGPHGGVNSNRNIGDFAFSIMYTGNEDVVSVENTGSAFILTVGETVHTFSYSTYETVDSLYEALSAINDIVLDYRGLETRQCSELAVFDSAYLVSNYYGITTSQDSGTEEEYRDAAPLFIPYSVSERWHLAEIVKIGNKVYSSVDGIIKQHSDFNNSKNLVLGGNCGVVFKEFAVSLDSSLDAELVTIPNGNNPITRVISSWNPHIVVLEGHGITKTPTYQVAVTEGNMDTSIDRLQLLFETYSTRGYVPVSLLEIADFYDGNRNLPKRCFTIIFDDFRWDNFLDLDNRTVFTKFGIRAALAIITDKEDPIVYNGTTLTKKEAADIGRRLGFDSVSHTRTHRKMTFRKPSDYISDLLADIYSADINGITSDILVYPYGLSNLYLQDVMAWVGMRLGIQVLNAYTDRAMNTFNTNRYTINREEMGFRQPISNILSKIV